jgi:hypothetical protein
MSQSPSLFDGWNTNANLYRCDFDDKLLREKDIASGKHAGHRIYYARRGDVWDWLLVQYWKLTGGL